MHEAAYSSGRVFICVKKRNERNRPSRSTFEGVSRVFQRLRENAFEVFGREKWNERNRPSRSM